MSGWIRFISRELDPDCVSSTRIQILAVDKEGDIFSTLTQNALFGHPVLKLCGLFTFYTKKVKIKRYRCKVLKSGKMGVGSLFHN